MKKNHLMSEFLQIKNSIDKAHKIIILIHEDPDGDAIGSGAALCLALRAQGKDVVLPFSGLVRETASSLRPFEVMTATWPSTFLPDIIIVLDSSDLLQLDEATRNRITSSNGISIINIDHHASNQHFANLNCVDTIASSTCEIIASYLSEFDYEISSWMAGFLLGGIVSDTGRFAYENTTDETLKISATLIELGANLPQITQDLESRISMEGIQLWGYVLANVKSAFGKHVVWSAVPADIYNQAEDAGLLMRDIGAFLRRMKDTKLAFLIKEKQIGKVGISFRSFGEVNCAVIAQQFDGGGHPGAAGCSYTGSILEAESAILNYLNSHIF